LPATGDGSGGRGPVKPWNDEKGFPEKQLTPFFDGKPVGDEDIRAINPTAKVPAVRALMEKLLYGRKPARI